MSGARGGLRLWCGEGDAPLGCKRAACRKNWHYPCAMEPTTGLVILEDEF